MSVTETLRALGNWNLKLREDMPASIWDKIGYFGHIVVHVGKVDPRVAGDSLLKTSRYTGVLRARSEQGEKKTIGGLGMAMWLGDPDNKGDIIETLVSFTGEDFQDVITALLPPSGSVTAGTIFNIAETWTGSHQFQSRREVIDYICQTVGAVWRVNGDGTLDAGLESDLFRVNPNVVVQRKPSHALSLTGSELDMFIRGFDGNLETESDTEDFSTRVVLMAQGSNGSFASATADIDPGLNPYKDLYGNAIKMTRIVQESETDPDNADARAQLQLNRFSSTRDALSLSTKYYDIKGEAEVGDYLWVWDPEMELVDVANEVMFRGQRIYPLKLKFTETTWPITKGMSVCYRDGDGSWFDLTDYFEPESGDTTIVVGGYNRSLSDGGSGSFPVTPPESNTTIPDITEWDLPFNQSMYQSPVTGESRSEVELKWFRPNNTDFSTMTDLSHYEIRYRTATTPFLDVTIDDVAPYQLDELETLEEPIQYEAAPEWQYAIAPGDVLRFRLQELTPSMPYEAQVRAVDTGRPANLGAWSDVIEFQTSRDILPPAVPAPPEIAANPMAVLMTHRLGRADGGEYNLDRDMHHLELHSGASPLFQPNNDTLIGKVLANWGMITGEIPIVASFQITTIGPQFYKCVAVDESGNKSMPSIAVEQTADLIDNQYVRNLTVDKVTAGTISADWIVGGYIRTGTQGARVELSYAGIHGYDPSGQRLLDWESDTGKLKVIGHGGIEITDGALRVLNASGNVIVELGECTDGRHGLQVYKDNGLRVARIGELESLGGDGIEFVDDFGGLVRANTMAFGMQAETISNVESAVASAGFQNFSAGGIGPTATVTIGNTLTAIVIIGSYINPLGGAALSNGGVLSFNTFGPSSYFSGGSYLRAFWLLDNPDDSALIGGSKAFAVTVPTPGAYTFQLVRWNTGQASSVCQFGDRHIIAMPY